jgi:hypothetical protein
MDTLIPDFGTGSEVDASTLAIYSPNYFTPVPGGDISPQGESVLSFPQCDTALSCGDGTATQDGTTGDTHDTSGLWTTLAGIGGSFLRGFTGGTGTIKVGTGTAPKPPVAASADNSMLWFFVAAAAVLIVILAVRR